MNISTRILAGVALVAIVLAQFAGVDSALAGGSLRWAAPGPLVGAGLPILAIGYGTYWLVAGSAASRIDSPVHFISKLCAIEARRSGAPQFFQSKFIPGQSLSVASGRCSHADNQGRAA